VQDTISSTYIPSSELSSFLLSLKFYSTLYSSTFFISPITHHTSFTMKTVYITLISAVLVASAPAPFVKPGPVVSDVAGTNNLATPAYTFERREAAVELRDSFLEVRQGKGNGKGNGGAAKGKGNGGAAKGKNNAAKGKGKGKNNNAAAAAAGT
jgi:hypothetical protein